MYSMCKPNGAGAIKSNTTNGPGALMDANADGTDKHELLVKHTGADCCSAALECLFFNDGVSPPLLICVANTG